MPANFHGQITTIDGLNWDLTLNVKYEMLRISEFKTMWFQIWIKETNLEKYKDRI